MFLEAFYLEVSTSLGNAPPFCVVYTVKPYRGTPCESRKKLATCLTSLCNSWRCFLNKLLRMPLHCRLASDPENDDLCTDGLRVDFTNFTWPTGVKSDRGFNISFTKDIILPPGTSAGGQDGAVVLSFKDNKNAYR